MTARATGVVLTGGRSTRMGADKATLMIDGKPMVVRVADALWEAGCHPVECQGGDAASLAEYGFDAYPDSDVHGGPTTAILDALRRHADAPVLVAACDLADLDAATVSSLLRLGSSADGIDVAVASTDGRRHLLACWLPGATGRLADVVAGGERAYLGALDGLRTIEVEVPERAVRNVNTPTDVVDGDSLGSP